MTHSCKYIYNRALATINRKFSKAHPKNQSQLSNQQSKNKTAGTELDRWWREKKRTVAGDALVTHQEQQAGTREMAD